MPNFIRAGEPNITGTCKLPCRCLFFYDLVDISLEMPLAYVVQYSQFCQFQYCIEVFIHIVVHTAPGKFIGTFVNGFMANEHFASHQSC